MLDTSSHAKDTRTYIIDVIDSSIIGRNEVKYYKLKNWLSMSLKYLKSNAIVIIIACEVHKSLKCTCSCGSFPSPIKHYLDNDYKFI